MKKILIIVFIALLLLTGCKKENSAAIDFKKEYESLNGVVNSSGKEHRTVTIDENNPYVKTTPEEVVEMIDNNETFFLYVGDSLCPWCRSVVEKSIEMSKESGVDKIYYVEIWDDEGNEILRDKYELEENKPVKTIDGKESYYKLLKSFDSVLSDYTLTDQDGNKIEVGEKRIFAPNYFFVNKGKVIQMISGISDKQKDSRGELTEEILKDEELQFGLFFELINTCPDASGC